MSTDDKKINVDDISFEDLIDGGIQDSTEVEELELETNETEETDAKVEEEVAENDLDADAKEKEEEESIEAPVQKSKAKKETSKSIEEDAEETSEKEDDSIVSQVLSTLGYEVDDAYEDTTEGLVALTKDVGTQIADETLDKLFEQYPLVGKHLEYVMNGGDSQQFMVTNDPRQDYSKIEIKETDTMSQKSVLSEYFRLKGHDKEFIDELLEDYEDSGKLQNKADSALKALAQAQAQHKEQMLEDQKKQQQNYVAEQQKFWDSVYDTIDKSKEFKGISIPEREKNKFFNYLSKPVTKEGYTQRDVDHNGSDMDVKLAIDYLMFKGFNLDKIINKKARTKSTRALKDKIKGHKESLKSAKKASRAPSTAVDIDSLDLSLF
tara:strand:- start:4627 stop:5763 length:1137 start_codon:yes stop_codon:yes gene_type:complete